MKNIASVRATLFAGFVGGLKHVSKTRVETIDEDRMTVTTQGAPIVAVRSDKDEEGYLRRRFAWWVTICGLLVVAAIHIVALRLYFQGHDGVWMLMSPWVVPVFATYAYFYAAFKGAAEANWLYGAVALSFVVSAGFVFIFNSSIALPAVYFFLAISIVFFDSMLQMREYALAEDTTVWKILTGLGDETGHYLLVRFKPNQGEVQ